MQDIFEESWLSIMHSFEKNCYSNNNKLRWIKNFIKKKLTISLYEKKILLKKIRGIKISCFKKINNKVKWIKFYFKKINNKFEWIKILFQKNQ